MNATRVAFGKQLAELGDVHPDVVVFDADLSKSTKSEYFAERFPERFFEMGIAEANMIGTAAGMSFCGKRPFICSFGAFIVGRQDIIRISIAYSNAPVVVVGTHSGIAIGPDGYTQMATEDIAVMRSLANMQVINPADGVEAAAATRYLMETREPAYLRLCRQSVADVMPDNYVFSIGKGFALREGKDVALIATGAMVHEALAAAETLAGEGIDASVINIASIKPIDEPLILDAAATCGKVVTLEDHNIHAGFGSAVAEVLGEKRPTPMKRIGVQDVFAESGDQAELYDKYGLSATRATAAIREFVSG